MRPWNEYKRYYSFRLLLIIDMNLLVFITTTTIMHIFENLRTIQGQSDRKKNDINILLSIVNEPLRKSTECGKVFCICVRAYWIFGV